MANYYLAFPGAAIDAILTTAYDLQNAGYIFKGSATNWSGTPTQRTWLLAPAGFSGYGFSSAIPKGSIGICKYNGSSWSGDLINVVTIDNYPTHDSTNAVTSGGMWQALDDLADGIWDTLQSFVIQDGTTSANQGTQIKFDVKMTDGQNVQHLISSFGILAATTAKAGLMSAADKAKVDAFLDNLRSLSFTDTTSGEDAGTKIVETLKMTVGGVQEAVTALTILAATTSKAGLLSASDKSYIDSLPSSLTSINADISKLLAMLGYYECSTAAATAAKEVSASGYVLTNGGCIRIKMTNANTADNVTLNINSTGSKALYYDGAQASSSNSWEAGEVLEVYYDGTQYQCASGGGGKFATGEKVKDTSITDQITQNSTALITSGAVYDMMSYKNVDLSQLTSQVCSLGGSKKWYRNGASGPQRHIALPVVAGQKYKLSAALSGALGYYAWCTNSYSPPYSSNQAIPMVASESDRLSINAGETIVVQAPTDAAYLIMTTVDGAGLSVSWTAYLLKNLLEFKTGEKISDVGITDEITENSDDLITSGGVSSILVGNEQTQETINPSSAGMNGSNRYKIDYNSINNGDVISFTGDGYLAYIGIVEGSGASESFVVNYTNNTYVSSLAPMRYNDGNGRHLRILIKKSDNSNFTAEDVLQHITYSVVRTSGGDGIIPNLNSVITRIGYYDCSTAAGTSAKEISVDGYTLVRGGCIRIKMANANTADNVTLNINSTGAKPLYYNGMRASSTNTWGDGETIIVYYDGENYQATPVLSNAKVQTITMIPTNSYSGKTFYNGSLINVNLARCLQYNVTNIKDVYITSSWESQDAGFYLVVFLDSSNNVISQQIGNTANVELSVTNRHVSVPEGAVTMYVNSRYYSNLPIAYKAAEYNDLDNEIDILKKEISILFIGNSLTQDAVSYVPLLMKELAPQVKFKFYIWYNGGYTLAQQLTKINNDQACEIFSVCENATSWSNQNNSVKLSTVLSTYTFDILCLQQYFNYQSNADTTSFNSIIEYIENNYVHPFKVITLFHAPLRSSAESVFNTTKAGNATLLRQTVAESMIPAGIAIYRALSTDLDSLGDRGHLSPDGTHAQEGLPCMMEAYVTALWILNELGIQQSVNNSSTVVNTDNYDSINVPGPNLGTGVVVGTQAQVRLSQKVAVMSFKEGKYFENANLTEYTT